MSLRYVLLLVAFSKVVASCHREEKSFPASEVSWEQRAWLDKTVGAILYGKSRVTPEEEKHLLTLSRAEAVDELMNRPEFYDTVLDFNLYFQGSKLEELHSGIGFSPNYQSEVLDSMPALVSAMEVAAGGDYFTLFDWQMPYFVGAKYIEPSRYARDPLKQSEIGRMTVEELQAYHWDQANTALKRIAAAFEGGAALTSVCSEFNDFDAIPSYIASISDLNLPDPFGSFANPSIEVQIKCGALGDVAPDSELRPALAEELSRLQKAHASLPELLGRLPRTVNQIKDFVRISPSSVPLVGDKNREGFSSVMWSQLENSSTNFNRRRAAYVLRTYFCDDLTPINIVAPSDHASDTHGSDAACAACHYKLDPMAGFFKTRGLGGIDFPSDKSDFLIHDDLLRREGKDFEDYLRSWKSPDAAREWNVGYVRSTTDASLNEYGEDLDDLFRIIRKSRESKVCLAKKMASYVLGAEQIYDGSWINHLAEKFHIAAQQGAAPGASSQAFKEVYKSLVLSETFGKADPEEGKCYDYAPGAKPSALPCAVSFIIEKNCASCHRGKGAQKGLDLTTWEDKGQGDMGFSHIEAGSGQPVPAGESLLRIKDRLSSSDSRLQMPLGRAMDPVERATLFKWIDSQLRETP